MQGFIKKARYQTGQQSGENRGLAAGVVSMGLGPLCVIAVWQSTIQVHFGIAVEERTSCPMQTLPTALALPRPRL